MKKLYIILIVLILITGCGRSNKENSEINDSKAKILESIGKTDDNQIVVKKLDQDDEDLYFVFKIDNKSYDQYCYRFFETKSQYDKWVKSYSSGSYRLETDASALMTKIYTQSGEQTGDKDLYSSIIEKYSDSKKYEIIK